MDERRAFIARIVGGLILAWLAGWLFEELSDVLKRTSTVNFDHHILLFTEAHRSRALTYLMLFFTFLGSLPVFAVWIALYGVHLLRQGKRIQASMLVINAVGAVAIIGLLKTVYKRARPTILPLIILPGFSFPSGHAVASTAIYGFMGYLISRHMPWYGKAATWVVYAILVLGICASRVYLGVHWPTDVIAGILAGLAWLLMCISALHLLEHRGWLAVFRR